ncbi:MAG: ParB/RepB/Spo0J family partition protein [candidate division NC10 bacterium]|nr:ParB/RepB/Spo0J family partition protein [candidate division NC10 bacterium]
MGRQALGRGLEALLPVGREEPGILEIPLAKIRPSPFQPRKRFDDAKLDELAASIRTRGVLSPVIVRQTPDGYELVAGERRVRAAERAGLDRVPAVVREMSNAEMLEVALIENLQREDLNPVEEAEVYRRLVEEFNLTQEEIASRVGKDRASVANTLRLLKLPPRIREDLIEGRLSAGHGRALLALEGRDLLLKAREAILRRSLSVRATELLVKRLKAAPADRARRRQGGALAAAEEQLRRALATKVRIVRQGRRGRIEVEFYSEEDLERLIEKICGR